MRGRRSPVGTVVFLAALLGLVHDSALARTKPATRASGFHLFARAIGALTVNRVYCGLDATGSICVDTLGSGVTGGGFWPKGTADQYLYDSFSWFAGIVGPDGGPWAGKAIAPEGWESLKPIYNHLDPADAADWPREALVPVGDVSAQLFEPVLQGRESASQGDVWSLMWGRTAGIVLELRGLGWNFPAGNEDVVYFVFTIYNATASDCSAYASLRLEIRDLLCGRGQAFHDQVAASGTQLPASGFTIENAYTGLGVDPDVAHSGLNYASANIPFALGYAYDNTFYTMEGWAFDPAIFSAPFFAGSGFVGIKYLGSPLTVAGQTSPLTLFSTYFLEQTPGNSEQLYRYLSGRPDAGLGDISCNTGDPAVTHICSIEYGAPSDIRFFQSSGPFTLPPGGAASVALAYIFAAPVKTAGCTPPCAVRPDSVTRLLDPAALAGGANTIDTLTGYTGFLGDMNGNGAVDQEEITAVPGSLLGKASVAQAVFDGHFLLPFAPENPAFFLIPGDSQVTVLWRPSRSETSGDPYFQLASQPVDQNGLPNPLYDPNYRQFDVEGYRLYRGRTDSPSALTLLAQWDYSGTLIADFAGQVNPTDRCAPELSIRDGCPETLPPGGFDSVGPGLARIHHLAYDLVGDVIQVQFGKRLSLTSGPAYITAADTAVVGGGTRGACAPSACPPLRNTGVPFVYVDRTPRNGFRYFYAVTAFDLNSYQSGPSTLESPRVTRAVTPVHGAPTYASAGRMLPAQTFGRGTRVDQRFALPTLDPTTGRFSGPFPAADGMAAVFVADLVSKVLADSGGYGLALDSMDAGSAYDDPPIPVRYYLTVTAGPNITRLVIPVLPDAFDGSGTGSAEFPAVSLANSLARIYGGDSSYALWSRVTLTLPGNYYTGAWGRGCINGAPGFDAGDGCDYNGTRWFDGPSPQQNETQADPTSGNGASSGAPDVDRTLANNAGFNNAGMLTGVSVIHQPLAYQTMPNVYRNVHGVLGSFKRAADYNVYWSPAVPGRIDSVVDVTHNLPLELDSVPARGMNTGFGVLTQTNAQPVQGSFDDRSELTIADFDCVEPLRHIAAAEDRIPCGTPDDHTDGPLYSLVRQATLGPITFAASSLADFQTSTNTGTGFGLYLAGNLYLIQTDLLPAGVVWSMRDYVGAISGGNGFAGPEGPYDFYSATRPFSAQGATMKVAFAANNTHRPVTAADLRRVHTVPDPYYVTDDYERTTENKIIKFVNLPERAIIRIYTSSGILVAILEHRSSTFGGEEDWNVRNRNNQIVASGVYFYHIEANVNGGTARRVGRMTIVNFAE
jgi:hypothetical protein